MGWMLLVLGGLALAARSRKARAQGTRRGSWWLALARQAGDRGVDLLEGLQQWRSVDEALVELGRDSRDHLVVVDESGNGEGKFWIRVRENFFGPGAVRPAVLRAHAGWWRAQAGASERRGAPLNLLSGLELWESAGSGPPGTSTEAFVALGQAISDKQVHTRTLGFVEGDVLTSVLPGPAPTAGEMVE